MCAAVHSPLLLPLWVRGATGGGRTSDFRRENGKIAFVAVRDGNQEIYVMNADGSGQMRLTFTPAIDRTPSSSPDGTKIAFASFRD
jgi:Tol biopolymer transport system component